MSTIWILLGFAAAAVLLFLADLVDMRARLRAWREEARGE